MAFPRIPKDGLNFLLSEIIGEEVEVVNCPVKGLNGLKGTIVDETLNTLMVQTSLGIKKVPKKNAGFYFPQHKVAVSGKILLVKPEERTKKMFAKIKK